MNDEATDGATSKRGLKGWQIGLMILAGLIVFQIVGEAIWRIADPTSWAAYDAERKATAAAAEAEQEARRQKEIDEADAEQAEAAEERRKGFHCLSAWDGSNRSTVRQVKEVLRNPSSFEHVETMIYPDMSGEHGLWMTYRAQNGFGGMNVERIYARVDHETCEARVLPGGPGS